MENISEKGTNANVVSEIAELKGNTVKAITGGVVILMCFFLVVAIIIAVAQMGM